jgi:hypothetical protein
MTDEDPLEQALYSAVESVIRQDYPNPNRDGCPDRSFLEKAATSPGGLNPAENALFVQHIPKCWPCFKELKLLRETAEERKPPRE